MPRIVPICAFRKKIKHRYIINLYTNILPIYYRNTIYRIQIPLAVAYACTIHKTQGLTLDSIATNLGKCFERAQGYVSISRVRKLSGLHLAKQVRRKDFNKKQKDQEQVDTEMQRLEELSVKTRERYIFDE